MAGILRRSSHDSAYRGGRSRGPCEASPRGAAGQPGARAPSTTTRGSRSSSCWRSHRRPVRRRRRAGRRSPRSILMIPLMLFNVPAGVLADRLSKRTVIVGDEGPGTRADARWAPRPCSFSPAGGLPAMAILGLLGVQAALFSPAKYGILPEILPHERLSSGNGLLEMWANLAIIGGTVAGGVIISLTGGRPWLGGPVLVGPLGRRPGRRAGDPPGPGRPVRGGAGRDAARSAGRRSGPTASSGWRSCGQIFVWAIASLVPAPVLAYASKVLGPARTGRRACRSRRSGSGSASARSRRAGSRRLEGRVRPAAARGARPDAEHAGLRARRARASRARSS